MTRNGSGFAEDKVVLLLDKTDVTQDAVITDRFVTYTPPEPLAPGDRAVELIVTNRAETLRPRPGLNIPRRRR